MNTLLIWLRMSAHALRLTGKAIARSWPWLFVAPALSFVLDLVSVPVLTMGGMVGGLLVGVLYAFAISLLLFIGRSIITLRSLSIEDIPEGFMTFFNDATAVLFAFWIASLLLRFVPPLLIVLALVPFVIPLFETVALTAYGRYAVFGAAWSFFTRDWLAWLVGQLPLVAVAMLWIVLQNLGIDALERSLAPGYVLRWSMFGLEAVKWALVFAAFLYRGVLFHLLDSTAPHARAARYGLKPT